MTTFGVIIGNRGFFPDHLCDQGRKDILRGLEEEGIDAILLDEDETAAFGSVATYEDARKCADLFKAHADEIDGILITLPNFGEESAIAVAMRYSGLDVPVMIHAFPDEVGKMTPDNRRDSFCGKMSCCNNLNQYGIKYSLTTLHTVDPHDPTFRADLRRFAGTCRIVGGLKNSRFGMIGARPEAFNTVRFSEKLLEASKISVITVDLSDILGDIERLADDDPDVKTMREKVRTYIDTEDVPEESIDRMAKFGVAVNRWNEEHDIEATAIQCWTSLEENYGIVPCTVMSMMSDSLMPSACETDITGAIGMYAMALASKTPSALIDWNNNYGTDPNKTVMFHCSNLPRSIFIDEIATMDFQAIIAGNVGAENAYGAVMGRIKAEPFTYCRVSTDDLNGKIRAYLGEGTLTDDPVETFGGYGVAEIPNLQDLLQLICREGFEHHSAINLSQVADAVYDAFTTYLGCDV